MYVQVNDCVGNGGDWETARREAYEGDCGFTEGYSVCIVGTAYNIPGTLYCRKARTTIGGARTANGVVDKPKVGTERRWTLVHGFSFCFRGFLLSENL